MEFMWQVFEIYYDGKLWEHSHSVEIGKTILKLHLKQGDVFTLEPIAEVKEHFGTYSLHNQQPPKDYHGELKIKSINYSLVEYFNGEITPKITIHLSKIK